MDSAKPRFKRMTLKKKTLKTFLKYTSVSLTAALMDYGIFCGITALLSGASDTARIWCATAVARLVSSCYNFLMTYKVVFKSHENVRRSMVLFGLLCAVQMCCSALLVLAFTRWTGWPSAIIKPLVDASLFFVAYQIQKKWIF